MTKHRKNTMMESAVKYPVFIGEVSCPPDWARDMLGLIQKHKLNWTGFSFHPKTALRVIQDWEYTPTPNWGMFVKEALAGKVFEREKMRWGTGISSLFTSSDEAPRGRLDLKKNRMTLGPCGLYQ